MLGLTPVWSEKLKEKFIDAFSDFLEFLNIMQVSEWWVCGGG